MRIHFLNFLVFFLLFQSIKGQDKFPPVDKSPLDISYCPTNYPILKVQAQLMDPLIARVIYSRPGKNGRNIFCDLIEYSKVWRMGANEATEIEFFEDVIINATKIKKGRYSMCVIPFEDKWTIIINKETDTWGTFMYNIKNDVVRMDVPVEILSQPIESLSIYFELKKNNVQMIIAWDNVKVTFPFTYVKKNK